MRKLLFIFFLGSTILNTACAATKVIERSQKRAPEWLYGVETGYLIVSAEADDLETAKAKAMTSVKQQIVNAIAENVHATSQTQTHELEANGTYSTMELYSTMVETESANIPFLSQVTIANATDYYWEKIRDKQKNEFYRYHIKYPFSRLDQMEMVDAFERQEAAINAKLEAFQQDDFSTYTSVEQMVAQATALRTFQATLLEKDVRRSTCDKILRGYKHYVEQLTIQAQEVTREHTIYRVFAGDRQLTCNIKPYLRSKCLTKMNFQPIGQDCVVTYDYSDCFKDEQNYIDITLTILGKKINNRFFIL